tara:strand:- start:3640 stop:4971 length:1332 start_codon:yes stop_codon:yes gene_type:complete
MIYGAQPTGIMATLPMDAQAAVGQFAVTNPDSPMGIESLAGGQEELAERLRAMGVPQYGLGSLFRKVVPKELRKVAAVVLPLVVGSVNPALGAATAAGLAKLEGASTEDALFAGGKAYLGAQIGGIDSLSTTQRIMAQAAGNFAVDKARGIETDDALRGALKQAAVSGLLQTGPGKTVSESIERGVGSLTKGAQNLFGAKVDTIPAAVPVEINELPDIGAEEISIMDQQVKDLLPDLNIDAKDITVDALSTNLGGGSPDLINVTGGLNLEEAATPAATPDSELGFGQRLTKKLGEATDEFIDDITLQNSFKDFVGAAAIPAGGLALLGGMLSADEMEEVRKLSPEQQELIIQQMLGTSGDPSYAEGAKQFGEFYSQRRKELGLNDGGEIVGPGTGTSDSVPALLSDGEFVMTAKAVRNAGGGNREKGAAKMYALMNKLEKGAA